MIPQKEKHKILVHTNAFTHLQIHTLISSFFSLNSGDSKEREYKETMMLVVTDKASKSSHQKCDRVKERV